MTPLPPLRPLLWTPPSHLSMVIINERPLILIQPFHSSFYSWHNPVNRSDRLTGRHFLLICFDVEVLPWALLLENRSECGPLVFPLPWFSVSCGPFNHVMHLAFWIWRNLRHTYPGASFITWRHHPSSVTSRGSLWRSRVRECMTPFLSALLPDVTVADVRLIPWLPDQWRSMNFH